MDIIDKCKMEVIVEDAIKEAEEAMNKYKRPFASAHEFYGVLMEEVDELWDEIKKKEQDYDKENQRKEATQCMAVLLRFINELT